MRKFDIEEAVQAFTSLNPCPAGVGFLPPLQRFVLIPHPTEDPSEPWEAHLNVYNGKWEIFLQGYRLGLGDEPAFTEGVFECSEDDFMKLYLHEKFIYLYRRVHDGNKV